MWRSWRSWRLSSSLIGVLQAKIRSVPTLLFLVILMSEFEAQLRLAEYLDILHIGGIYEYLWWEGHNPWDRDDPMLSKQAAQSELDEDYVLENILK